MEIRTRRWGFSPDVKPSAQGHSLEYSEPPCLKPPKLSRGSITRHVRNCFFWVLIIYSMGVSSASSLPFVLFLLNSVRLDAPSDEEQTQDVGAVNLKWVKLLVLGNTQHLVAML